MKKPLCFCLGFTDDWAFAGATVLLGLRDKLKISEYDVVIYHQNLSQEHKERLNKIHKCIFREYHYRDDGIVSERILMRLPELTFARYECFNLLEEYETAVWLDSDILILDDFSEILEKEGEGIKMKAHVGIPMRNSFRKDIIGYDMQTVLFNTGIIILHDHLEAYSSLTTYCYEQTKLYSEYINSDQAVINLMLQDFNIKVKHLAEKYNSSPVNGVNGSVISHPWGATKFWNGYINHTWNKYADEWFQSKTKVS